VRTESVIAVVLVGVGVYVALGLMRRTSPQSALAMTAAKPVGAYGAADWRRVFDALPREATYAERRAAEAARLTAAQGVTQGALIGTSIFPGYGTAIGAAGGFILSEIY
jgi:hypothetical protein